MKAGISSEKVFRFNDFQAGIVWCMVCARVVLYICQLHSHNISFPSQTNFAMPEMSLEKIEGIPSTPLDNNFVTKAMSFQEFLKASKNSSKYYYWNGKVCCAVLYDVPTPTTVIHTFMSSTLLHNTPLTYIFCTPHR